jgi:hypothetical protein
MNDLSAARPLLIGMSARIHYPDHDPLGAQRPGTGGWSKTVH